MYVLLCDYVREHLPLIAETVVTFTMSCNT
jgi:hypothetical protein